MANQNLFSGKIVVVAKSDTADYRTIVEAIENVEPATRILVQPGVYRESIVLDKPVEIVGDGQVSDIVIESIDASCILMETESSVVRGLTLHNTNHEKEHKYFAINISQGKLILEDCNITSDSDGCIAIALVYFQFSRKGFRKRFVISIISMTVFLGITLAEIYISGLNGENVWFLTTIGCLLHVFTVSPVFEQANLMSNYDIKKLSSKKQ